MIEGLTFLSSIDTMLLEGVSAPDVAKYIQEEMGELKDVDPKALASALRVRRRQKEEVAHAFSGRMAAEAEGDEPEVVNTRAAVKPSLMSKKLAERQGKGGIKDLLELEALFLSQRDRLDRMVELEAKQGIFAKDVGAEILFAKEIILARTKVKKDLGVDDATDVPTLDMRRYSEETVGVLSKPESRHRVMSLLQRLSKMGKLKKTQAEPESEDQIVLPPPTTTED